MFGTDGESSRACGTQPQVVRPPASRSRSRSRTASRSNELRPLFAFLAPSLCAFAVPPLATSECVINAPWVHRYGTDQTGFQNCLQGLESSISGNVGRGTWRAVGRGYSALFAQRSPVWSFTTHWVLNDERDSHGLPRPPTGGKRPMAEGHPLWERRAVRALRWVIPAVRRCGGWRVGPAGAWCRSGCRRCG